MIIVLCSIATVDICRAIVTVEFIPHAPPSTDVRHRVLSVICKTHAQNQRKNSSMYYICETADEWNNIKKNSHRFRY